MLRLLFFLLSLLMIFSFSFAVQGDYERSDGNCNRGDTDYYKTLLEDGSIFKNKKVITEDVFAKAIENLEKYCNNEKDTLSTPIFINHIIDIGFRKVDGIKGAAYGVKLDEQAVEYRKNLNKIEEEYETDPKEISKLFKSFWGDPNQNVKANEKTLYGKYMLICEETLSLSDKLLSSNSKNNKTQPMYNGSLRASCNNLVEKRYSQETMLMHNIAIQNYYNHVNQQLFKKLNEEFTEKIGKVFDSVMEMLGDFEYVVRRYIHATDVEAE